MDSGYSWSELQTKSLWYRSRKPRKGERSLESRNIQQSITIVLVISFNIFITISIITQGLQLSIKHSNKRFTLNFNIFKLNTLLEFRKIQYIAAMMYVHNLSEMIADSFVFV